jgi:hypothetical protein
MEEEDEDMINDYDTARYHTGASSNPNRRSVKSKPISNISKLNNGKN